jgi:Cytochrome c7 and related cytochrome c
MSWRPSGIRAALLAGALLLGAGAYAVLGPPDQINPNHAGHAKAQVECLTCHENIFDVTKLGEPGVLPKEAKCLGCHKKQKEDGNCAMCHYHPDKPRSYVTRDIHLAFNHAKHLEKDENCSVCHLVLPGPGQLEPPLPPMKVCLGCHNHEQQFSAGRCDVCHQDLVRFPLKPVSGTFSHQGNFTSAHIPIARSSSAACSVCHTQKFCGDCHSAQTAAMRIEAVQPDKPNKNFIHWGDYLTRHSIDARGNESRCQTCHVVSFCEQCHRSAGLTPSSANPLNPHPAGWDTPGSPQFHGTAARNDIVSCATCHDQGPQTICVNCHRVGGPGGNPHPPSFAGKHPLSEVNRNPMCLYCHR